MVYHCRRCKEDAELREGTKTGNNALNYRKLTEEVNASGVLKVEKRPLHPVLCPKCLDELDKWIKARGGPFGLPPLRTSVRSQPT